VLGRASTRGAANIQLDACAFIYPSEQHEGIRRIVQGFQSAAHQAKRRVVTLTTGMDFQKESEIVGRLGEFDVKGAVVYPVLPEMQDRLFFAQMLAACRFPVVLVDVTLPGFGGSAVVVDGFHAGYTMTRHLLAQGVRRIGFLTNYAWAPFTQSRYRGYCWALEESGIEIDASLTLLEPSMRPDFADPQAEGRVLTKRFLEHADNLGGIVCGNDFLALSCLVSAREMGVQVPDQLKVVGIDDYALSAHSEPPLTTYHIPYEQMGRDAFLQLDRLLLEAKLPPSEKLVRGSLVARRSG
jgi:DNA-binding LacI/PurR family transcriptional regulator